MKITEERVNEHDHRSVECIQFEKQRKKETGKEQFSDFGN